MNITDNQLSDGIPVVSLPVTFAQYDPPGNYIPGVNLDFGFDLLLPFSQEDYNDWETVRDNSLPGGIHTVNVHDSSPYVPAACSGLFLPGKLFVCRYFIDMGG